ncbi:MAG: c-type cytochrome [Rhodoferax sp.]|nr:MAG: c-type cytochrome [Rhodoferax sp.]
MKPGLLARRAVGAAIVAGGATSLLGPVHGQADLSDAVQGEHTAGAATAFVSGRNAFSMPFATLDDAERARFAVGNSFFRRNWVQAPASTTARDGLGPHFIARSCGGCHVQDGRGAPPEVRKDGKHEQPVGLLVRLSVPGVGANGGVVPDPVYGDQLNNAAVEGVQPEGLVRIRTQPLHGRFADGTRYTLQKPVYTLDTLAYGPLAPGVMLSPRVAPQIAGVGLIEAIRDDDILDNERRQQASGGPVRGQVNRVWDDFAQALRIGRLGWKANQASVASQTAGAFLGDIGITSPQHPTEACMPAQKDCLASPKGAHGQDTEIDARTLSDVIFYQATLAPAARRKVDLPQVQRGAALFAQAQCDSCHRPSYITGDAPFAGLSSPKVKGLKIWPYTDLLLHDMGEALADGRPDYAANGRQWKTPPLWGVGLIRDVNGHQRLLHDGRARGVMEAVLWHGGEATAAREQVRRLNAKDRAALVAFVESL